LSLNFKNNKFTIKRSPKPLHSILNETKRNQEVFSFDEPISNQQFFDSIDKNDVPKYIKNTFRRSKIVKRRNSKLQKINLKLDENEFKESSFASSDLSFVTRQRDVVLERDNDLGFGFIAGSEKPLVIRFISPSNYNFQVLLVRKIKNKLRM
jgi:hypothetical protein